MSRLPTSLRGLDAVQRAQEQNRSGFYHILMIWRLLLLNWTKVPFFVLFIITGHLLLIGAFLLGTYTLFCCWINRHVYLGPPAMMLFSLISGAGIYLIGQYFSDTTIMFSVGLAVFFWGCSRYIPIEALEMNELFHQPYVCLTLHALSLVLVKITLLLIRLFYWLLTPYIAIGLLMLINLYSGMKIYQIYSRATAARTNQPLMPV